jgi:hypothetical protein
VWLAQSFTAEDVVYAEESAANAPVGTAKGIHPGRVVWVHEPDATDWDGPGSGHWWENSHTDQAVVDRMMGSAIRTLTGEAANADAWNKLFEHFNKARGKGSVGYKHGEKVVVKVNFVGCIRIWKGRDVADVADYNLRSVDYMNTDNRSAAAARERGRCKRGGYHGRRYSVLFPE